MAHGGRFDVLIATDGSAQARAAVATAAAFPWPTGSRAHAVIARRGALGIGPATAEWPAAVWDALERNLERVARATRRALATRWPDADVVVVDRPPVEAILTRARAVGADVIVVGSRGYGALGRLLLGSVSRACVRRARVPVLVVKGRPRPVRRVVLGLDGSASARSALRLLARLRAPRGGRVTVLSVLEPVRTPSLGLLPGAVRGVVGRGMAIATTQRERQARRDVEVAAAALERAGWRARPVVVEGVPLRELLAAAGRGRADLLVLGARGTGGVERLLLGSVAEGALGRSPVSVLIAR